MCDEYDGYNEFHSDGERRARKEHTCSACHEIIPKGHRYHYTVIKYDSELEDWKHCLRCWAICKALWATGARAIDMDLNCGETWEDPPPEVAALAFTTQEEMQKWTP